MRRMALNGDPTKDVTMNSKPLYDPGVEICLAVTPIVTHVARGVSLRIEVTVCLHLNVYFFGGHAALRLHFTIALTTMNSDHLPANGHGNTANILTKSSNPAIIAIGNPLLDLQANVNLEFLKKYEVKANDAILVDTRHEGIFEDLLNNFGVTYLTGGSALNSVKMIQWLLESVEVGKCAYMGCVGRDRTSNILEESLKSFGVTTCLQKLGTKETGVCAVLITDTNRSLVTAPNAAGFFTPEFLEEKDSWKLIETASLFIIAVSRQRNLSFKTFPFYRD